MRRLLVVLLVAWSLPAFAKPKQGKGCDAKGQCANGLTCVRYRGVAGARGPEMTSCEIRCDAEKACPKNQQCVTIADGPGQVCRPRAQPESEHGS